jgi:hypothetical protein
MAISHPPPINPQLIYSQRFRFSCTTAATNKVITFQDLLDMMGVAVTAILGYELFDQVKLSAVECWAVPILGANTQVSVQFAAAQAGGVGDGRVHSDSSMGIEPAHVLARPNVMSQTAQWQTYQSAGSCFLLTCPVGAVIDVACSFRTLSALAPTPAQNALVGATIGDIYYRGLDGLGAAATTLPAQAPVTA